MQAITIWQPWASFIVSGHKRYETRHWYTPYRGLIAIHAGRTWKPAQRRDLSRLNGLHPDLPHLEMPPVLGQMLAIGRLIDVHKAEDIRGGLSSMERDLGGYTDGRFAWEIDVLEVFETPIPAQGQQGLWSWELPGNLLMDRIAIVGSRKYDRLEDVRRYVRSLPVGATIISGGAAGVDEAAERAAVECGLRVVSIPVLTDGLPSQDAARRREYGRRAYERNQHIVDLAGRVVAFWDEKSRGTADTLRRAKEAGKDVIVNPTVDRSPVQLTLSGFDIFDEGAVIDVLAKNKKIAEDSSPDIEPYEWKWPRKNGDQVWVPTYFSNPRRDGLSRGGYRLVDMNSEMAQGHGRVLGGVLGRSERLRFEDWLMSHEGFIDVPLPYRLLPWQVVVYVRDMVDYDAITHTGIPLNQLMLTQDSYNPGIAVKYLRQGTMAEFDSGTLPFVVKFEDDPNYYVLNGTHRAIAMMMARREIGYLPSRLWRCPMTIDQLKAKADGDDSEFFAEVLEQAMYIIQGKEPVYA